MYSQVKGALLLVVLLVIPLAASDIAGKILGSVMDSSSAVVPNATVTATNNETGSVATAVSGDSGVYAFESLAPGVYTLICKHPGFRRFVVAEVRVMAQRSLTLPITLTVGDLLELVEVPVSGAVDVTSSATQTTLASHDLLSLPVLGRDLRSAVERLQPGVVELANDRGNTISYNGNRTNSNAYRLEGGDVNNYFNGMQQENTTFPQAENLEEFSILTNANEAKYGSTGGAHVTAVIRSGTNTPHGRAWTYLANQGWAANSWAANRDGVRRPPGSQRWVGANLGAPIVMPRIYDGHNRSFFFFSYEHTNPSRSSLNPMILPTSAERTGHFGGGAFPCPRLDGLEVCDVSPSRFSPLAKTILAHGLVPMGDARGRYSWTPRRQLLTDSYVLKIDQNLGQRQRLSGAMTRNNQNPESDDFGSCCGLPGVLPGISSVRNPHHITSMFFNHVLTLNASLVNTVSVGGSHTRVAVEQDRSNPGIAWDKLGLPGVTPDRGALATDVGLWVNAWNPAGFALFGGYYDARTADTTNISELMSWAVKRHTLEFGYNQRIHDQTKVGTWGAAGQLSYQTWNVGSTGNAWADFLLDQGGEFSQSSAENTARTYASRSAFLQDRIGVTRRLTATVGLRWDPHEGYLEQKDRFSVYSAGQQSIVYPHAPAGQLYYGDPGVSRSGYRNKWWNLSPRASLAYDLTGTGRLALRAGYGIYTDYMTSQGLALDAILPFSRSYTTSLQPGTFHIGQDPYRGSRPFPFSPPLPGSQAAHQFAFPVDPQNTQSFSPGFNSGRIHEWATSVQWEPWLTYLWTFGYVGNRGTHLLGENDVNTPLFIPNASDNSNQQARRPDPHFQSVLERSSDLNSRYNALQVSLNKRFSGGFALLASYTLADSKADGGNVPNEAGVSGYRDVRRRYLDYGPAPMDIRHRAALYYNFDLPFFREAAGWRKRLFSGWNWGGTLVAQSGFPLTITAASLFNAGSAGAYANYAGGKIYGDHSSRATQAQTWLDRSAFCRPDQSASPAGCITDPAVGISRLGLGDTTKGFARGPGKLFNDMALVKRIPVVERRAALEFRAAAFNVFNHTVLGEPDTSLDSSNFGAISSAAAPRSVQLSVRFEF